VALGSNSGTAGCINRDLHLRHKSLQKQSIGYHTDIRAETDEFYLITAVFLHQMLCQVNRAEGRFTDNRCLTDIQLIRNLPTHRVPDAMRNRQLPAFLGVHISICMGILCEQDGNPRFFILLYLGLYLRNDGNRFRCSKRSVDKIILHINNN
jgi:hypothetical protein